MLEEYIVDILGEFEWEGDLYDASDGPLAEAPESEEEKTLSEKPRTL